jgi:nucleoside 2-deoxyribosyltransferase
VSSQFKVYLAGPITGLTFDTATDWRVSMRSKVGHMSGGRIECYSPLRSKGYLAEVGTIEDSYEDHPLSSQRGIMTRDRFDVMSSDLVMVNFLGTGRVSIGTVMEIAWADMLRKPIVMAIEESGNLHDHSMVREAAGYRVESLDAAAGLICMVLLP